MDRKQLNTVAAKTDAEIASLAFVEQAALDKMIAQGNAADVRVEAVQADYQKKLDAANAALKAKDAEHAQALEAANAATAKATADGAAALKAAADAAAADKAKGDAALAAAADAKALVDGALATANGQIATLQGMVAAAEDRATKAEAGATEAVAKAAATVAEMEAKLASDDRQWNVSLSPLRAHVAASLPGESPSLAFQAFVNAKLDEVGIPDALVEAAIARTIESPADVQAQLLILLGAPELVGQKPELIEKRLRLYGKKLFEELPEDERNALVVNLSSQVKA